MRQKIKSEESTYVRSSTGLRKKTVALARFIPVGKVNLSYGECMG